MIIVGGTFIVTSAVVYGILILSMMVLTSVFFERYADIIGKALGAVILVLGIVNAKELVISGKGPSLSCARGPHGGDRAAVLPDRRRAQAELDSSRSPWG